MAHQCEKENNENRNGMASMSNAAGNNENISMKIIENQCGVKWR
jgi:hypothetical protein